MLNYVVLLGLAVALTLAIIILHNS